MNFRGLDPRAQLAVLAALLLGTLFAGVPGLAGGAVAAIVTNSGRARAARTLRVIIAVAPLALSVALLDALAGRAAQGAQAAIRLLEVTAIAISFAGSVDGNAIAAGLRALRVPFAFVFVLLTGARFVPIAASDLGELVDAARLRGIAGAGSAWLRFATWRVLLIPLLVVTVRRGLKLGEAMEARGFASGAGRTSLVALRWQGRDTLVAVLALLYLTALVAVGLSGPW